MLLTMWTGATYSGEWIQYEAAPQTAISGMALLNGLILVALLLNYENLRPPDVMRRQVSREASEFSEEVVRTQSLNFGDTPLPIADEELFKAEELLEDAASTEAKLDHPLLRGSGKSGALSF